MELNFSFIPVHFHAVGEAFYFVSKGSRKIINVTLKGGVVKEFENGTTALEIAKSLGAGLFKATCGCKVNGEEKDLRTALNEDCEVEILTFDSEEGKQLLAQWGVEGEYIGVGNCILGYPDEDPAMKPRKPDYIRYID